MNLNGRLVGLRSAEHVGLPHGNRCVSRDEHLHQASDGFQTQRKRRHVIQQQIPQLAGENSGLHSSADRDHFIGVYGLAWVEWNQGAHQLLHHRHAGGATHQHNIIYIVCSPARITQRGLNRHEQTIQQIRTQGLEGAPIQIGLHVQGSVVARGDERQRNRRSEHA